VGGWGKRRIHGKIFIWIKSAPTRPKLSRVKLNRKRSAAGITCIFFENLVDQL